MLSCIGLSASVLAKHAEEEGGGGEVALRHAERLGRFTARMDRLVGDLLDVVGLAFRPAYAARGIELRTVVPAGSLGATFDHDGILQVLANLLSNALKFTEHGGNVTLAVERTAADISFSVTDTGLGIPADQVTAIFERFRQVTMNDRRGLGLGLYIAKSIVEAHGGRIWAERPAAGGTALHFLLPSTGPFSSAVRAF